MGDLFFFGGNETFHFKARNSPEHACGGSGNISVVELLRRATMEPSDCGLKLRSCCIKSDDSNIATSEIKTEFNFVPLKPRN
jgi:hypothetical protein